MILSIWRRGVGIPLAAAIACLLLVPAAHAQKKDDKKEQAKLDQAQQAEVQQLAALVDAAMGGQPGPSDLQVAWQNDFLKALEGKTYVPFTLTSDAKLGATPLALYLRVTPRGAPAAAPVPTSGKKDDKKKDDPASRAYPFEDVHFIQPQAAPPGQPFRVSRAFAVPAGEYDVYIALRERATAAAAATTAGNAPAGTAAAPAATPRTTVIKQQISVPDFWASELTTSTIILADRVEPLKEPLPKEQQAERPYTLGATEILPAVDSTFGKKEELSVLFLIYNPGLGPDKRPDLNVEYTFHTKAGDTEKYFNKTSPQTFNAQSLPPQFDLAAGHQLVAGQSVPLASFPEGEYRLEIKIKDNVTGKELTRSVKFTVAS